MLSPEKHMNAIAIKPAVMKMIPIPCSGFGISLYSSFSRIPAMQTIASIHPKPEPNAKANASPRLAIAFVLAGSSKIRCCMNREPPMIAQFTAISGRKIPNDE